MPSDTRYSPTKVLRHLDRMHQLQNGKRPVPVMLQLILSDLCNQDCSFCSYRASNGRSVELFGGRNPNRKIPTEKAVEIIEDAAALGVKSIEFTGGGEPTVHPDHDRLFVMAQDAGISTGLITNGVKLNPTDPGILGMTWIRVSLDAGTQETYCRTRRVSELHWDRVMTNLASMAESYSGTLSLSYSVTLDNYHEIPVAAALCRSMGVPSMRVGAIWTTDGDPYGDRVDEIRESIRQAEALQTDRFSITNQFDHRLEVEADGAPSRPLCGYQYLKLLIGASLEVYRCCHTAYTSRGLAGSLKDQTLRQYLKPELDEFDARGCTSCHWREQNEAIADLMEEPEHAAFI